METTLELINQLLNLLDSLNFLMDSRNLWTFAAMSALLIKGKPAHLYILARALPYKGQEESKAQRLRRWLSNIDIRPDDFLVLFLSLWSVLYQE